MTIRIEEVLNRSDLKRFIGFPYDLYKNHPYWVPPIRVDELNTLRSDKNPAYEHCDARFWLALNDKKVVGRIAAILNHKAIDKWEKKQLRFGWFDFIDALAVSSMLLQTVETWASELELDAVHGPLGFTDLDYEGMLVEGFDELGTMAALYNYPY